MPRISADSVAEHVAQQEAAVFDAAIRLFVERGYQNVGLGDIAAEVGLKRNSLYRYFPDKAHILVRWFRAETDAQTQLAREVLDGAGSPVARIDRWVVEQLDYARRPEHALLAAMQDLIPGLDEATREELGESHRKLFRPLDDVLAEAGIEDAARRGVVRDLILAMVLAAARREARSGPDPMVREQLDIAIHSLIG